jgi:nucleoside-diphosphate-sugar epimerase
MECQAMTNWNGKRVLVTGGSGFIGSHLTRRLVKLGANVAITTKYHSPVDNIRVVDLWDQITALEADLRNFESLRPIAAWKPEVIFHLAAYNHVGDSFTHIRENIDSNTLATANLFETCHDYERFIYTSTSEVYGYQDSVPFVEGMEPQPISPYSIGKYAGELYARMRMRMQSAPIVALRPFNAFGPYQSPKAIISEMIDTCLAGRPVLSTQGRQTREFNYVENLVDGFILAAEKPEAIGQVINLGSGEEISIRDLIQTIHKETGSSSELKIGALHDRPTEIWRMSADSSRAKQLLGWEPKIPFLDGLRRTIAWYKNYHQAFHGKNSLLAHIADWTA